MPKVVRAAKLEAPSTAALLARQKLEIHALKQQLRKRSLLTALYVVSTLHKHQKLAVVREFKLGTHRHRLGVIQREAAKKISRKTKRVIARIKHPMNSTPHLIGKKQQQV